MASACGMQRLLPAATLRQFQPCVSSELTCLPGGHSTVGPKRRSDAPRHSPSAAALDTADVQTTRPPCSKDVWVAPIPSQFIEDQRAFVEEHRIRGYEADPNQCTTMTTVANLLQEVASNHAVAMWGRSAEGFATDPALAEEGLIFVMIRMQIQMDTYPRWGDVVQIVTWFQESGKIGAQRDWIMRDKATGQVLGRATSSWVMINMHTRRLSKMPDPIRIRCGWYQRDPPQNAIPVELTRAKLPDLALPAELNGPLQVARRMDMDMNGHINNVTYIAWVMETVPKEVYESCHLYQLEVDYKAECHAGDAVESVAAHAELSEALANNGAGPDALSFVHMLRRCEGDKCTELVRARTTWRAGPRT